MLGELLSTLRAQAASSARNLGLAREHAALVARYARVDSAWQPHLEASRQSVLRAARLCARRRTAAIVGAGNCLDVPVAELASQFEQVLLLDVVISPTARKWARRSAGRVQVRSWDATGVLGTVARQRRTLSAPEAETLFLQGQPALPLSVEPDLLVSANCLSQLGLIPGDALAASHFDLSLPQRCADAAAQTHLRWLASCSGSVRLLLADISRLDVDAHADGDAEGEVLRREELLDGLDLPPPERTWRWNLAPIPEWSRSYHRVHEVGAWIWAASRGQ